MRTRRMDDEELARRQGRGMVHGRLRNKPETMTSWKGCGSPSGLGQITKGIAGPAKESKE